MTDSRTPPPPSRWVKMSDGVKLLTLVVTLIGTIGGATWAGVQAVGTPIYRYLDSQTRFQAHIEASVSSIADQLTDAKNKIAGENELREQALKAMSAEIVPRVDALERQTSATDAVLTDIKGHIDHVEKLAEDNLRVSQSHDDDIRATRRVIAPRPGDGQPHGMQ